MATMTYSQRFTTHKDSLEIPEIREAMMDMICLSISRSARAALGDDVRVEEVKITEHEMVFDPLPEDHPDYDPETDDFEPFTLVEFYADAKVVTP